MRKLAKWGQLNKDTGNYVGYGKPKACVVCDNSFYPVLRSDIRCERCYRRLIIVKAKASK